MAPEALLHGRISKAADMYSFGITLWELFTGGQAYQGTCFSANGRDWRMLPVTRSSRAQSCGVRPQADVAALHATRLPNVRTALPHQDSDQWPTLSGRQ